MQKKLKSKDFVDKMPLPADASYTDESYRIDTDALNGGASMTDDFRRGPYMYLTDEELKAIGHPTRGAEKETGES